MPCYEYQCNKCKHKFEKFLPINQRDKVSCPKCKSKEVQRMLSRANFRVQWSRGRGFYQPS